MTDETTATSEEAAEAAKAKASEEAKAEETKVAEEKAKAEAKKSPKDHIIERKQAQLEKANAEKQALEEEIKAFGPPQDDEMTMQQLFDRNQEIEDKISAFIKENPSLEEHREKIKQYARDPSRKNIPIDEIIVGAVGYDNIMKMGAEIKKKADKDANDSKMGGNTAPSGEEPTEEQKKIADRLNKLPKFLEKSKEAYDKLNS